jgi:cytochrome c oxidase subunit 2
LEYAPTASGGGVSLKRQHRIAALGLAVAGSLCACDGPQSALVPAGRDARQMATLFWWMIVGSAIIWLLVVGLTLFATYRRGEPIAASRARLLVVLGGAVFPTVVLTPLLVWGLSLLPDVLEPAPEGSLRVEVAGEQWWWRVRYLPPGGQAVELANEIRLPVNEPVQLELSSRDVIHAFWVPALGGKMDMIPGRRTLLRLLPTRTGEFRGVCAEYCGGSHAHMAFRVVVTSRPEFERWLAAQAQPAPAPRVARAERGRRLFLASGCGACHTVRGTAADGVVGPDLTHVGSRLSLGAGRLANDAEALRRWITHTEELKPMVLMPAFDMLPEDDVRAIAAYLEGLE